MGLLDGILGNVAGSVLGGGQAQGANPLEAMLGNLGGGNQAGGGANILGAVMSLVQQNGGLTGVLNMLQSSGLGQQANSWVGTGANANVSADQMSQVFGNAGIGNLAAQLGTSQGQAGSILSQVLPELVNQLTPNGQVPDNHNDLLSQGLSALLRR
jgi:uncharacterized protein YidB (DUF937 family)